MLADLAHGKLVNLRPESVQHEFVNTTLTREHRTSFAIDDGAWDPSGPRSSELKGFVTGVIADLGTCLSINLYEEALIYFLGGENTVERSVEVYRNGQAIGTQLTTLVAPNAAFKVTAVADRNRPRTEDHLRRFLIHTNLYAIQWINVGREKVTFKTIHPES